MGTQQYKRIYNIPFSFDDILKLIRSLTIEDKLKVEKELETETLLFRAQKLDKNIKNNNLTMEDILSEIKEYRAEGNE